MPGKPRAYLNWIMLDEQFNYVSSQSGAKPVERPDEAFNGLGLRSSYFMGSYEMKKVNGVSIIETSEAPENTLAPPNTKEFYLYTHFDIYKEHDVKRP